MPISFISLRVPDFILSSFLSAFDFMLQCEQVKRWLFQFKVPLYMSSCGNCVVGDMYLIQKACFASLMAHLAKQELMDVIAVSCSMKLCLPISLSLL